MKDAAEGKYHLCYKEEGEDRCSKEKVICASLPTIAPTNAPTVAPTIAPTACFPEGLSIDFDGAGYSNDINNLGGYRGPGVTLNKENNVCKGKLDWGVEPPLGGCPCGCGCVCSDLPPAPPGSPQQLLFSQVAKQYDGTQSEPVRVLVPQPIDHTPPNLRPPHSPHSAWPPPQDLILTNETEYTPWSSMNNGRQGNSFGEVSVAAGTDTRFKFAFADSDDPEKVPVEVPHCARHRTSME